MTDNNEQCPARDVTGYMNSSREHEQPPEREREWLDEVEIKWAVCFFEDEGAHELTTGRLNNALINKYGTPAEFEQRIREDERKKVADYLSISRAKVQDGEIKSLRRRVRELEDILEPVSQHLYNYSKILYDSLEYGPYSTRGISVRQWHNKLRELMTKGDR